MKFTSHLFIGILFSFFLMLQVNSYAQNEPIDEDIFEMSLEDLFNQSITTVSKSAEKITDAPGIVSILSKDEIAMFGGTTLSAILERIPGLSLSSSSLSDRSIVSARGEQITSTSNHTLLLLNGRPIRETLEGGVSSEMYESFPISSIERIEVIKGPGSVLYGSNAFSGVINIITHTVDKTNLSASGYGNLSGGYGASADFQIKSGDFELLASGQYHQKPIWETEFTYVPNQQGQPMPPANDGNETLPTPENPQPPGNGMTPINETLTQRVSIPNEGTGIFIDAKYKKLNFTTSYNNLKTLSFEAPGESKWDKAFGNLGYDLNFTEKWNSTINLSYTNASYETDSFPNIKRNSYEIMAEWTHNLTLSEKAKLVFGGLYAYSDGSEINKNDNSIGVEGDRYSFGAYTQADYQILKSLKITTGLQINKIENIDVKLVPRAALVWNPTQNLNFKALYSEAFRAPSIMELYLDQAFRQGNTALQPEKIGTIDLGASYRNENFQIGLSYFHSNLTDIINLEHITNIPTYQNLGQLTFNGFEIETKYYANQNLYLTGSALYQNNKNSMGETNISPSSNISAKGGINYISNGGISLGLFNVFQGPIDIKYESDFNASPITSFNKLSFHADVNANKLLNLSTQNHISLFLHADNILNTQIWTYTKSNQLNSSIPFNQGRVINAGITITMN